jgi:hypothetical protein
MDRRHFRQSFAVFLVLAWVLLLFVHVPPASAITVYNDGRQPSQPVTYAWYYAVQDTYRTTGTEYWGWHGVEGDFNWVTDGSMVNANHVNACVGMNLHSDVADWAQAGVWRYSGSGNVTRLYYEVYINGVGQPILNAAVSAPSAHWAQVSETGVTDARGYTQWKTTVDAFVGVSYHDRDYGKAVVQNEVQENSPTYQGTVPPKVYFGTRLERYNNSSQAIYLMTSGHSWLQWTEQPLSGLTGRAHQWQPPNDNAIKYTVGYPYYYFGAWRP